MNSIPVTAVTVATAVAYDGNTEPIDRTETAIITTTTATATSSFSHAFSSAISNLTTSTVTTSANITAISKEFQTPNSIRKARNNAFHSFPIVNTPTPPSRFRKIVNPFESAITERLHLPLIDSPSLFHRPATPQLCSTQLEFEWTIDHISTLNPANVEAHETQFVSSVDPELEAKAQAAISSYFKETIIVPSPDDCPLRDQKIILGKTATKDNQQLTAARVICDNSCQTELTLPPILPKDVEDALRPFFTYTENQQRTPTKDCDSSFNITMQNASIDHDARDASLRRKLFQTAVMSDHSAEYESELHLDSPAPQTPEMKLSDIRSLRFMTSHHIIQDGNEKFGSISPISTDLTATPSSRPKSPPSSRKKDDCEASSSLYRSTPDYSLGRCKSFDMTTDNNINYSQMNSKRKSFHVNDERSSESSETVSFSYDDEMQLSYGSQHHHPQTPHMNRSKRHCNSVSRKNLSRSFNQIEEQHQQSTTSIHRTDSGFNDMNECGSQHTTQSYHQPQLNLEENFTFDNITMMKSCDVSMASIN